MLNRFQITALCLVSLTVLLILVWIGTSLPKSPTSPIVFGHLAVPTATNADFVAVTLTNLSDSTVVYLAWPPEVKSNGIWTGTPPAPRQKMSKLLAGQSGLAFVAAASTNENSRVPLLWGYQDYNPGANRWQQLREDFVGRIRGHGGRGFLYTNYLTDLKL